MRDNCAVGAQQWRWSGGAGVAGRRGLAAVFVVQWWYRLAAAVGLALLMAVAL